MIYRPVHFKFMEMVVTSTKLDNIPNDWTVISNMMQSGAMLDVIRRRLGLPVIVNSGYRSEAVNSKVGGSKTSQHLTGMAFDIRTKDAKSLPTLKGICTELAKSKFTCMGLGIDQCIIHKGFVHVGMSERPRFQIIEKGD